jgi:uncharacterized membrane-anchored protein
MSISNQPDELRARADQPLRKKLLGLAEHQQRLKLNGELNAGRVDLLRAPTQVSHLALMCGSDQVDAQRGLIAQLCERYGVTPPTLHATHFNADFGSFRINWEHHTEYSSYTFTRNAAFEAPFMDSAIRHVPEEWLASLPGEVIAATHIALEGKERPRRTLDELALIFAPHALIGAEVAAGSATVWTDNQIHADGFGRILIQDKDLRPRQAGRLVQRLREIETYRMLAMLPVPMMRAYIPQLAEFDERLAALTENNLMLESLEDEQQLLNQLTKLAAEIERISAKTSQRVNASRMYYDIVKLRVAQLREKRIQGLQMFQEFMDQRLSPAMGSCALVHTKLETLSIRVERASSFLRTRVEISMERQSRDLLSSMDRRAHLQLRLQETVEGLSIVVLSYYLVGLVAYGFKAVSAAGYSFNTELATGLAIPLVVAVVFLLIRRLRRMV